MNNIAGDKMFAHLDRFIGERMPVTADIFLTNYCNNKCPYCTYGRWELDEGAYSMKYEDFVSYADRLLALGVMGFILTGGGEPTLCKDFEKITDWLERNKVHWGINTNFNKMIYAKPDYIKISLDGWDRESYIKSRGVDAYEKVCENIKEFVKWRDENSPKTTIGVQRVVTDYKDVIKFYVANKDLPVDYLSLRPIESTYGQFYNDKFAAEDAYLTVRAIDGLSSSDKRVVKNFKWDMLNKKTDTCTAQWAQIAVNERGQVMYCCHKPYQIVGHVLDKDILEKKANAYTDMRRCDIPCRMTAPNLFAVEIEKQRKDAYFI